MLIDTTKIIGLSEDSWLLERIPSMTSYKLFYYIQSGGHFYAAKEYYKKRTGYDSILLLYTLNGIGFLNYNEKKYEIVQGKGFIIDCNKSHTYGCLNSNKNNSWEFVYIHFNGNQSKDYVSSIINNSSPIFKLEQESCILNNINKILVLLKKGEVQIDVRSSVFIIEVLTELYLKNFSDMNTNPQYSYISKDIIYLIERNYSRNLSLDFFSKNLNLSKYYLVRQFKKQTGFTISEYILKYRLRQSKQLLMNTDLTISEISNSIGFNDTAYFCRIFKKYENTTPTQYRDEWR